MSSYGTDLQNRISQVGQQDVKYMEIVHWLQQGVGTCTGIGIDSGIGTEKSIGTNTSTGIGVGAQGMDYCLTMDGLVRFIDRIYVPDSSELKKVILREFHAKPYSGHPGYQNTLTAMNTFYYWLNLKRDLATL